MWKHEYPLWEKYYPKGKVILDVGAEKESIAFFQSKGSYVIPIGPDVPLLSGWYDPQLNVRQKVDGIKIDIDGAEWGMVIETHAYKPRLRKLYQFPKTGTAIYRLEKGPRAGISFYKRFRIWLALRRRFG